MIFSIIWRQNDLAHRLGSIFENGILLAKGAMMLLGAIYSSLAILCPCGWVVGGFGLYLVRGAMGERAQISARKEYTENETAWPSEVKVQ